MPPKESGEVAGLDVLTWIELWSDSHAVIQGAPVRLSWPDGYCTLQQPAITTEMFSLITDEYAKELQEALRRNGDGTGTF